MSREAWLLSVVEEARPFFEAAGHPIPATVRVGIGHMVGSAKAIGQCWSDKSSDDGVREIWIKPYTRDRMEIVATLIHELCHAALPWEQDDGKPTAHRKPFIQLARAMDLEGKPTATYAGDDFKSTWEPIIERLGPYEGGIVTKVAKKAPKNPAQVKISCSCCGIKLWLTPKMREQIQGTMQCVDVDCGSEMQDGDFEKEGA